MRRRAKAKVPKGYRLVTFGEDLKTCKLCGEPICGHRVHWGDCTVCIGPMETDIDYLEVDGRLYGRRSSEAS